MAKGALHGFDADSSREAKTGVGVAPGVAGDGLIDAGKGGEFSEAVVVCPA